jgi:CheY-like chemotaxis protein
VVQDVSEQKATETRLRSQQRLAEQANVAKSQFMANMSHELRTPLNGVLGMLELIQRQPVDDKTSRYCDIALNSGYALLRLVEDLLSFETLSSSGLSLDPANFKAQTLLETAIAPLEPAAQQKGLSLSKQCLAKGQYYGDAKRIAQVISNILGNAIKFTPDGEVRIRINDRADGSGLHIVVSDTGIGMPADFIAHAFDRFTQSDASATRSHEGAGLGLSIAKGIVDAMDGAITLASEEGAGTTVTIDLPLPAAKPSLITVEPGPVEPPASDRPVRRRSRILIAEDNEMNRSTIEAMLDDGRFQLTFAASGTEALELASKEAFDLMILDIQMPGCSGDEVLKTVREAQKGGAPTPAIACTANAYEAQRDAYRAAGFDSVVTKPIDLTKLEAEVARLLAA